MPIAVSLKHTTNVITSRVNTRDIRGSKLRRTWSWKFLAIHCWIMWPLWDGALTCWKMYGFPCVTEIIQSFYASNGSIDSGTLKKEIRKHQVVVVFVAHDPPELPERLQIFFSSQSKPLRKFYAITDLFAIHSSDFLISGKQLHSWLHFKFHLIKKAFRVGQAIIPVSLGQELSSRHHTRPLMKVFPHRMMDSSTCISSEFLIDFQEYSSTRMTNAGVSKLSSCDNVVSRMKRLSHKIWQPALSSLL